MRVMKIVFAVLLMMFMVKVEAATAETVYDGEAVSRIKRLAVAYPMYFKAGEKEPELVEFINLISEAGSVSKEVQVITYDQMIDKIKGDTGIDIKVLPKKDAKRIYEEQVYKFADAYLVITLANNSRANMFCEVRIPNTNDTAYVLRVEGSKFDENKTAKSYKGMAEEFYRTFEKAVKTEEKKLQKKEETKK